MKELYEEYNKLNLYLLLNHRWMSDSQIERYLEQMAKLNTKIYAMQRQSADSQSVDEQTNQCSLFEVSDLLEKKKRGLGI